MPGAYNARAVEPNLDPDSVITMRCSITFTGSIPTPHPSARATTRMSSERVPKGNDVGDWEDYESGSIAHVDPIGPPPEWMQDSSRTYEEWTLTSTTSGTRKLQWDWTPVEGNNYEIYIYTTATRHTIEAVCTVTTLVDGSPVYSRTRTLRLGYSSATKYDPPASGAYTLWCIVDGDYGVITTINP